MDLFIEQNTKKQIWL